MFAPHHRGEVQELTVWLWCAQISVLNRVIYVGSVKQGKSTSELESEMRLRCS